MYFMFILSILNLPIMAINIKNIYKDLTEDEPEKEIYSNIETIRESMKSMSIENKITLFMVLIFNKILIYLYLNSGIIIYYDTGSILWLILGITLSVLCVIGFIKFFMYILTNKQILIRRSIIDKSISVIKIVYGIHLISYFSQQVLF